MPHWVKRRQISLFWGISLLLAALWPVTWSIAEAQTLKRVDLVLRTDHQTTVIDAEIVDTPRTRAKGLMFREDLEQGQGMVFVFQKEAPRSFWMKNTPLSLDILFFDSEGQFINCLLYTSPSPRDLSTSRMPSSA